MRKNPSLQIRIQPKTTKFFLGTFIFLGLFCYGSFAEAASLALTPETGVYTTGAVFQARIVVDTKGKKINAAEGVIKFNPSQITVVGVSKGSVFNLWTAEPSYSNTAGTISFSGGSPTGYSGSGGTILTISFRSNGSGASKVSFQSGSVLAADGLGTNVLQGMSGGTYTIAAAQAQPEPEVIEYVAPANTPAAPSITSSTHPDAAAWYTKKSAKLSWSLPGDVTAVRTSLNNQPGSVPTKVYDNPISDIALDDLENGVHYFHLQFKNAEGWGRVSHYRIAIDTDKPAEFTIDLPENVDLSSPNQTLLLKVKEETSSVRRFLVQLDGGAPYEHITESSSTLPLLDLAPGHHTVIIEAFDAAGNSIISTFSFAILAFNKPQFTEYPTELNEGVIPVIRGITRPKSTVDVQLKNIANPDATKEYQVIADEAGIFTIIPSAALETGVYELVAVATDQFGAKSEPSDLVRIAVQKPGYIQLGSLVLSVLSVIVPMMALILLMIFALVYFVSRVRRTRVTVRRETEEALEMLANSFVDLREVITDHEEKLMKSRKSGKLTKAEDGLLADLRTSLTKAEKNIRAEVDDVDDTV